jgi:hypothetical protein
VFIVLQVERAETKLPAEFTFEVLAPLKTVWRAMVERAVSAAAALKADILSAVKVI